MNDLAPLFEELISAQRAKMLQLAQRIIPHIIEDDLLQPNDFPQLDQNPLFRYEEGVLEGILTVRAMYLACSKMGHPI